MALTLADPSAQRGFIFTFVGEGGLGKTSLAAAFPSPIFIPTEEGLIPPHAARFPLCESSEEIINYLYQLGSEQHNYRTVVIDTITQGNVLIEQEIVDRDPKKPKSINTALGGYGAGSGAASRVHMNIRNWAGALSRKGMHVVFLAHANTETVKPPDQDEYYRYSIRMGPRSVSHYSDNTDLVGYIKLQTHTRKTGEGVSERTLASSTGIRVISCYPSAASIAKNRFGITTDIEFPLGTNPFEPLVGPA
jgi:GTPase SAR1 family protein